METVDGRSPGRERKVHKIKKQLFNRFGLVLIDIAFFYHHKPRASSQAWLEPCHFPGRLCKRSKRTIAPNIKIISILCFA